MKRRLSPLVARPLLLWPWWSSPRRQHLARVAALRLIESGGDAAADRLVRRTLPRLDSQKLRADLLGEVVTAGLEAGRQPDLARDAYAARLDVADAHLASGRPGRAAKSFAAATRIAFHRVLHFDHLSSPLAADPAGFTAPLRSSRVAQAVAAPRGRSRAPESPRSRPLRVLLATRRNDDFLGEIRRMLQEHDDVDVRFVDFQADQALNRVAGSIARRVLDGGAADVEAVERALRPHLDEVDVVFVEWCTALAALVTLIDPGSTRVIVRMHSYEAFTPWPHLMDFSRVDDVVFVSEHLRDLAVASVPGLSGTDAPRRHVLTNAMDLTACRRPKQDDARLTLALLGASKVVKDPRWAIEVLRRLRRHDDRYRLLLIGGRFQHEHGAATQAYGEALARDLAELEPAGAVEVIRYTDDVPGVLERVGVILSTSVRESFHIGLVEGASSGAVPVVRDWPFFPGAARELFPAEWVVETPDEAAERILAATADAERWRALGEEAAELVTARWDWSVVQRDYLDLLGVTSHPPTSSGG